MVKKMRFFSLRPQRMAAVGSKSFSSRCGESDDCELTKQQRETTTPAYSNDACLKQSFQTRLKVGLGAALHARCTPGTTMH